MKRNSRTPVSLFFMALMAVSAKPIWAQSEADLLSETDQILNSEQIDIDGLYKQKQKTAADRIAEQRKVLEDKNEQLVRKKIEDIRIKEEQKLTRDLQKAFNGGLQPEVDTVETTQAAPQKVEAPAPAPEPVVVSEPSQLGSATLSAGLLNVSGTGLDVESSFNGGVAFDFNVSRRVTMGFEFNYSKIEMTDTAFNDLFNNYNYQSPSCYYNGYYQQCGNPTYSSYYGQGREIEYKRMGLGLTGKFFILAEGIVRPYIGLGVGYNRTKFSYVQNSNFSYQSYSYGNEEYNSNYFSGSVLLGSEFHLAKQFALSLGLRYETLFGQNGQGDIQNYYYQPDAIRLANIADQFEDASYLSVNIGALFIF